LTKRIDGDNISLFKKYSAIIFYGFFNFLTGLNLESGAADFRLIDKKVLQLLKINNERNLFLRGLIESIGFNKCYLEYKPGNRTLGQSKYTLKKMLLFAIDGITAFSVKPLRLAFFLGAFISFLSALYAGYALCIYFFSDKAIAGWTSILISVLLLGGVQLITLGIMGEYLSKIYMQVRGRPTYIIKENQD